jgi:hypothetical protein
MDMFASGGAMFDLDYAVPYDEASSHSYTLDECAPALYLRPADKAISGTELRRRLITPEAIAAISTEEPRPSLLQRLLRRR